MNYNSWLSGTLALLTAIILALLFLIIWNLIFRKETKKNSRIQLHKHLRFLLIGVLLFALFYFDFLRDYVFKNLEQRMHFLYRMAHMEDSSQVIDFTDSNLLGFLGNISYKQTYLYKYIFFGLFTLAYFLVCSLAVKLAYPKINTTKFTTFLYGIGISLSLIIFSLYFFPWQPDTKNGFYLISMEIGHFFQSSLPTLLLLVSFKIYQAYPIESSR